MDQVQHIASVAAEPVEASDNQFVSRPHEGEHRREFGTAFPTGPRNLLRPNDAAPFSLQTGELQFEIGTAIG